LILESLFQLVDSLKEYTHPLCKDSPLLAELTIAPGLLDHFVPYLGCNVNESCPTVLSGGQIIGGMSVTLGAVAVRLATLAAQGDEGTPSESSSLGEDAFQRCGERLLEPADSLAESADVSSHLVCNYLIRISDCQG